MNWQEEPHPNASQGFSLKNMGKQQWLVLLLFGLLLAVIAMPVSKKDGEEADSGLSVSKSRDEETSDRLERKLEQVLGQVEGVGNVQVMLYPSNTSNSWSSLETSACVQGVLIVAEGADDPVIVQKIQESVMALFQVEAHKIKVMKMK
ncbi:MAG: hypothetical protein Q4F24_10530 [Eubacteriales bacterium]|nr:hypothetical protein [Eubacteriales bacterium]